MYTKSEKCYRGQSLADYDEPADHEMRRFLNDGRAARDSKTPASDLTQNIRQRTENIEQSMKDDRIYETDNRAGTDHGNFIPELQLQLDLKVAQAKIKSLEGRLKNLEKLYSAKGTQLQSESSAIREECNTQKQMYLNCLQEIEEKNELIRKKLQTALSENVNLRKKNQVISENEKSLLEEISHLKLSLKVTLQDRRRIRNVLKSIEQGNNGLGTEEFYRRTTERAQAILNRRNDSERGTSNRHGGSQSALNSVVSKTKLCGGGDEEDEIIQELFYIF